MTSVAGTAVAVFGLVNAAMCIWMILAPDSWSDAAIRYCQHRFMHLFELLIMFGFGAVFLAFARESVYSVVLIIAGYWFVAVGLALVFVGPSRHRRFGVWSIRKVRPFLRLAAVTWLFVSGWFVRVGLSGG